jgi:hypothetical protein
MPGTTIVYPSLTPGYICGRPAALPGRGAPDQPVLDAPTERRPTSDSRAERRIFCAAATSTDYALLSPCVRRYGYGAPQRRVCDESFACYVLWKPKWRYIAFVAFVERVTRSTATVRYPGERGEMRL